MIVLQTFAVALIALVALVLAWATLFAVWAAYGAFEETVKWEKDNPVLSRAYRHDGWVEVAAAAVCAVASGALVWAAIQVAGEAW